MEMEADAICTWFHTLNSISSFLNEGGNKEMELRLGKNYIPLPLGQPGQTLIHTQTLFLKVSGSTMSPWWIKNMTTQKHKGNELPAGLS